MATLKERALAERERRRRLREKERGLQTVNKPSWSEFAKQTRIRSGRNLVPFDPYPYQIAFVEQVEKHYGTVAVKSRQMGFTEMVASYFLWSAYQDSGYLAVIFSKTQGDTANIAKRVRLMVATHPNLELETDNLQDLKLVDGGRLLFKPATANAARGLESVSALLFDEAAFVDDIEKIYSSAMPSTEMLGEDAKIIILSTPNGQSGFYWDRVNESNGDINVIEACKEVRIGEPIKHWTDQGGWCKFLAHWRAHPIYSQKPDYLKNLAVQKRMPETKIEQEYDLSFTKSQEGRLIKKFDENRHVLRGSDSALCTYDSKLPLHLIFDFNRSPATALVGQQHKTELRVIYEFCLWDSDTFELAETVCNWVKGIGHKGHCYIYGDATGRNPSANSRQTNWQIVWSKLKAHKIRAFKRYKDSNPSIADSVLSLEYAFEIDKVFINGETCPELIADLNVVKGKDGGIAKIDKSDPKRTHWLDELRYWVDSLMPYRGTQTNKPRQAHRRLKGIVS